ncbi:MAG TPA: hypothetical protein VK989_07870 [Polyangia bacterium]|jgi:hypothetical protein|nr:hypothetical protein [Polyangia bacterium]
MATKNLARTILEAGRTSEGTWGRREDNRVQRARTRRALAALRDEDDPDDFTLPLVKKTNRHLDDKLGAPSRWLASHVGRPWDKVRGELFARFDTRTLAGRHIVFGHMLTWVDDGTSRIGFCATKFRVDRHGILRLAIPPERS